MPNTVRAMPSARPMRFDETAGKAINRAPAAMKKTDRAIYPVFATHIGAVERIFIWIPHLFYTNYLMY